MGTRVRLVLVGSVVSIAFGAGAMMQRVADARQVHFLAPRGPAPDTKEPRGYPLFTKLESMLANRPMVKVPADEEMKALLLTRYAASVRKVQVYRSGYESGRISIDRVLSELPQLRDAYLALSNDPADHLPMLEFCLEAARYRESVELKKFDQLKVEMPSLEQATFDRADAHIRVLQAKQAIKTSKK